MTSNSQPSVGLPFPEYFSQLAGNYARQTGNATRRLFSLSFDDINAELPITKDSVIHDNAAGPGTATSVLVDRLSTELGLPSILVTDNVPPMVTAAKDSFQSWPEIETQVLDSLDLSSVPENKFTHSILNFSIFTFMDPLKGLQEIHRTLQPGGLAVLTAYKHFGAGHIIHATQALIRPDLPPMRVPHPEFMNEGALADLAIQAGFDKANFKESSRSIVVSGVELEGLKGFMLGDFTKPARAGWTEEEVARWPEAIDKALEKELGEFGGTKDETEREWEKYVNYTLNNSPGRDWLRSDLQLYIPNDHDGQKPEFAGSTFNITQGAVTSMIKIFSQGFGPLVASFGAATEGNVSQYIYPSLGNVEQPGFIYSLGETRNVTKSFETVARSLTKWMRDRVPKDSYLSGEVRQMVVITRVQWKYLVWPSATLLGGIVFSILAILETKRMRVPAWRNNALAMLANGPSPVLERNLETAVLTKDLTGMARRTGVVFEYRDGLGKIVQREKQ